MAPRAHPHLTPPPTIAGSILVLLLASGAAAQPALTEARYVERVLQGSLEARVAEAEAELERAAAVGVGQWPNPSLAWQREKATSGLADGASQDIVNISIPLVLSGRLGLAREAASDGARAADANLARARGALRHVATRAFAAVLATRERRAILDESLAALDRLAQAIAVRERAGEAAGYDRLRIEAEAAAVEDARSGAGLEERRALTEALRLLGPATKSLPPLQGPLAAERPLPSADVLRLELESRRADARALEWEARAARTASRAAGRGWIPDPTVYGGVQLLDLGRPGEGAGYVVGLTLPLPLFERQQGPRAQAEARERLARARRAELLDVAHARLTLALAEVTERRERRARQREGALKRAEALRDIAEAAYRGGSADLLVLMDAERTAREARLTAVDLALDVVEAEADLLLLAGAWDGADAGSAQP
ncbi:TolC family protein [Myxococcus stipitatus]|uniref:TolC family protein n=1 Tax=Myxococcus stipitatus TaxID=83455 RepID=UPI001F3177E1|nr:TolC family protein [Myxococcus stipitatus]MCE9671703.1 TolC family protein [Myxococcus stipitatus]